MISTANRLRAVRDALIRAANRGAGATSAEDAFNAAVADVDGAEQLLNAVICDLEAGDGWRPIATAPEGYDGTRFNYVLFHGVSKGRSFDHPVAVTGYMDHDRRPVHFYNYKLHITHWMPHPADPVRHDG